MCKESASLHQRNRPCPALVRQPGCVCRAPSEDCWTERGTLQRPCPDPAASSSLSSAESSAWSTNTHNTFKKTQLETHNTSYTPKKTCNTYKHYNITHPLHLLSPETHT